MTNWRSILAKSFAAILLGIGCTTKADQPEADQGYISGFSTVRKTATELYKALDEKNRLVLHPQPVTLEMPDAPQVIPIETKEDGQPLRQVSISAGCIDLLNRVSHAKAIDKIQPGYFEQYIESLGKETKDGSLPDLPNGTEKKFWSEDVMNDQISYFNQMAGMVIGINLSHHYLKHFDKYSAKLQDGAGHPVPINSLLTQDEWDKSIRAAAVNSLNCAMATGGIQAFFEAINRMPKRPAWTLYFLPANVDVKKMNNQLTKYEVDFFHGKLK